MNGTDCQWTNATIADALNEAGICATLQPVTGRQVSKMRRDGTLPGFLDFAVSRGLLPG